MVKSPWGNTNSTGSIAPRNTPLSLDPQRESSVSAAVSSGYLFCKLLTFSVGLTSGKVCATSHC